ncbi:MAG TPA: SDR family NAD(P)-dependent oxidoreductase [Opitutaceae bacterium]
MNALFSLHERRALVTGSSQGLGLAIARGLAEAGATVVLNGRDPDKLENAAASLRADRLDVESSAFDVTDEAAVNAAVASLGPVDILVNNAGIRFRHRPGALRRWRRPLLPLSIMHKHRGHLILRSQFAADRT